ncbi:MAG TPA: response regulator [Candidatus Wallbacteria bacterium]|nr:response regulator [Candidatus Wallbacteria bacterium]
MLDDIPENNVSAGGKADEYNRKIFNPVTAPPGAPAVKTPLILIAEDSPMNMKLFISIFKKLIPGAEILTAEDGAKALELFKIYRPDLVFMDIQMPVMDGYETARNIREFEKACPEKKSRIIALTASVVKGEKEKCENAGMDCFMTKPLNYKLIKTIIEDLQKELPVPSK